MEQFTQIDFQIQKHFFNPSTAHWLVNAEAFWPRIFFYTGPKLILFTFGGWILLSLIVQKSVMRPKALKPPRSAVFFLAGLILIPLAVSSLKSVTNVRCPYELTVFGGTHEYARVYDACCGGAGDGGRCFPAGHASGGFALLSLFFVGRTRRERRKGVVIGLVVGWTMALYQMLKGAHFLSHSLVTMLLAWLILEGLAEAFKLARSPVASPSARMSSTDVLSGSGHPAPRFRS